MIIWLEKKLKSFEQLSVLLASALLLATFVFLLIRIVIPSTSIVHGFMGNYVPSVLLVQGKLGPQAYDNEWFIQQVRIVTGQPISEVLAPSLPTVSLLALPFTFLQPQPARELWIWFNLFILLAGLGLLVTTYAQLDQSKARFSLWLTFIAFSFIFPPVAANFLAGQSIILFFGLFVLTLFGLVNRQDWLVGLTLGLALILKTTGLPLWLLLIVHRRWQALGWGIATTASIALVSLPWIGIDTWWAYLQAIWNITGGPISAVTAYQTTYGFFTHLFRFDLTWNPAPILDWPGLAQPLTLFVTIATMTITLWLGRVTALVIDFFAALIPLGVVLLPVGEEHHFIILLLPIFILVNDLIEHSSAKESLLLDWLLLGLALFLLVAPIPYEHPALSVGWLAILAYPRLFGAWLIWIIVIRRMFAKQVTLHLKG